MRARPARFSGNEAKLFFKFEAVDFIDHAVDFKGKRRTGRRNFVVEGGECFPLTTSRMCATGNPSSAKRSSTPDCVLAKGSETSPSE